MTERIYRSDITKHVDAHRLIEEWQKQSVLELFDEQVNMSQYLEEIQDSEKYFSELRTKLAKQSPEPGHDLTALLVIPSGSTEVLMNRINLNGMRGYTSLDQVDIHEFYPTTIFPYVVTGVELNSDRTAQNPREVRAHYEYSTKRPLTLNEGVSLLTYYPEILYAADGISLPGSTHREHGTLDIYRDADRPKLKREAISEQIDPNWLVPICDRKIITVDND